MRLRPPYNPQKSKNKRFKKYKTNTTEEEKADSLRRKQKQTACSASRKESKKYKKEKTPRKENASLSLRRKIKAKNRECKNHWERKYISPSTKGKEFPLVNPFLSCFDSCNLKTLIYQGIRYSFFCLLHYSFTENKLEDFIPKALNPPFVIQSLNYLLFSTDFCPSFCILRPSNTMAAFSSVVHFF